MAEERRSSLSWDMGGSFETGQASKEISQQELAEVRARADNLDHQLYKTKKLLEGSQADFRDLSNEFSKVRRQNAEHETLSRTLLFILSATSLVDLTILILKYARNINLDPNLALAALERLYGDVSAKALPHIIEIIKEDAVQDALDDDLCGEGINLEA